LYASKVEWDEPYTGQLLNKCYFWSVADVASKCSFHGFCDASLGAYAAVVYVKIETSCGTSTSFIAFKTRILPVSKQTISRNRNQ